MIRPVPHLIFFSSEKLTDTKGKFIAVFVLGWLYKLWVAKKQNTYFSLSDYNLNLFETPVNSLISTLSCTLDTVTESSSSA